MKQAPPRRLPVKVQLASNRSDRCPTTDLPPPLLSQHLNLPERSPVEVDRPLCRQHPAPPLSTWGGEFSMTTHGDYWVTRDTRYGRIVRSREADPRHSRRRVWNWSRRVQLEPPCRMQSASSPSRTSSRRDRLPPVRARRKSRTSGTRTPRPGA